MEIEVKNERPCGPRNKGGLGSQKKQTFIKPKIRKDCQIAEGQAFINQTIEGMGVTIF
jgi:hypothetical protein